MGESLMLRQFFPSSGGNGNAEILIFSSNKPDFVVPNHSGNIYVMCYGAGGGGRGGGGAGAGGYMNTGNFDISNGEIINIIIGTGGANSGQTGGTTFFGSYLSAAGGGGASAGPGNGGSGAGGGGIGYQFGNGAYVLNTQSNSKGTIAGRSKYSTVQAEDGYYGKAGKSNFYTRKDEDSGWWTCWGGCGGGGGYIGNGGNGDVVQWVYSRMNQGGGGGIGDGSTGATAAGIGAGGSEWGTSTSFFGTSGGNGLCAIWYNPV